MDVHEEKATVSAVNMIPDGEHYDGSREEEVFRAAKSYSSMNGMMYALAFWGMSASIGYAFG
jgi:hypothetical protein